MTTDMEPLNLTYEQSIIFCSIEHVGLTTSEIRTIDVGLLLVPSIFNGNITNESGRTIRLVSVNKVQLSIE